jgi:hypothetical protein
MINNPFELPQDVQCNLHRLRNEIPKVLICIIVDGSAVLVFQSLSLVYSLVW